MSWFACRVCGCREGRVLFRTQDRLTGVPGEFALWRCAKCRILLTQPVPKDIAAYYPSDAYGPHQPGPPPSLPRTWSSDGYLFPPLPAGSRILELGCGRGEFLRMALRLGWRAEGIEPAAGAAEKARAFGAAVQNRPIEECTLPENRYDAIFAWMALEHLAAPMETVRRLHLALKPRGLFVFSVPDAGSWEFQVFGPDWYALDCPRHLTHFDRGSIRRLLRASGFRPAGWRWQRNLSNVVGSVGLRLGIARLRAFPDRPWRPLFAALYPLACLLAALRRGGRLTVVARKEAR